MFCSCRELEYRRQTFKAHYFEVILRSEEAFRECLKQRLLPIFRWTKKKTTEEIADKIASTLTSELPSENLQFIVAVFRDVGPPMKARTSARYVFSNQDAITVAVFPLKQNFRYQANGKAVRDFCHRAIPGAGDKTFCDVGSVDGGFVFDRLRKEGIVPPENELVVVPKLGQLAVREIPPRSVPSLRFEMFPDFDIVLF